MVELQVGSEGRDPVARDLPFIDGGGNRLAVVADRRLHLVLLATDVHDLSSTGREGQTDAGSDAVSANVLESRPEGFVVDVAVRCHTSGIGDSRANLEPCERTMRTLR